MKIKIEHANKIIEKYGQEDVPLIMHSDLRIPSHSFQLTGGMQFTQEHYGILKNSPVKEIDIIFSEKLLAKLATNFPADYRHPVARKNVVEMDKLVDSLEASNYLSKRKRCVISLTEIYKKNPLGIFETVLQYGEKLHQKKWNEIKYNIGRNTVIDYRFDECGIIIFFILGPGDPQYAHKFMKFTELITLVVESARMDVSFSPDFNPVTDVYTVNDKHSLLETYNNTKADLIILGEELNEDYKTALNMVKAYDRYARMMVIKSIDQANKKQLLEQIKKLYNLAFWEE